MGIIDLKGVRMDQVPVDQIPVSGEQGESLASQVPVRRDFRTLLVRRVKDFFLEKKARWVVLGFVFLVAAVAGLILVLKLAGSASFSKPTRTPASKFKLDPISKEPVPTPAPTSLPGPTVSSQPTLEPTPSPEPPVPVAGDIDLDVTYLERTPRYKRYEVCYQPSGFNPYLCNGQGDQRWPKKGESVTFTAHVLNKGKEPTGSFHYQWYLDGVGVKSGVHQSLAPGEEGTEEYNWIWDHDVEDERLLGEHLVRFLADSDSLKTETCEANNLLEERTDALGFRIFFSTEQYEALNTVRNRRGSYSAEDWIQDQFDAMRDRFKKARYPLTPNGIEEVVRIDKIAVVPNDQVRHLMETDPDKRGTDGAWQFYCSPGETVECQGQKYGCDTESAGHASCYAQLFQAETDWGLIHELTHQLGIIDLYRMNTANVPEPVNGNEVNGESRGFDYPGLMGGGDTRPYQDDTYYSSHTAYAFNLHKGFRRGHYGEYLFDLPARNFLEVKDRYGNPIVGAKIEVFKKDEDEIIRQPPKFTGAIDDNGLFELPNRDASWGPTKTGHILKPNPFGPVNVVGTQGLFLIKITAGLEVDDVFLDQTLFNLAYWIGKTDSAIYSIEFDPDS